MEAQKKQLLRSRLTPELTLDSDEILLIKLTLNSILELRSYSKHGFEMSG